MRMRYNVIVHNTLEVFLLNNGYEDKILPNSKIGNFKKKETDPVALLKYAKDNIPALFSPENYEVWLRLLSRFHRYSYINVILIYMQYSEASYLAGFKTWQAASLNIWNDNQRQILKNEQKGQGIQLLAPYTQIIDKNSEKRRLTNFIVSVFDVSQTNDIPPLEQDAEYIASPKSHKLLSALRHLSPYRITVAGKENHILQNGMTGYCDHSNRLIVLDEELKGPKLLANTLREVIAAELEELEYNEEFIDLVVESVFWVINSRFGFCVSKESAGLSFVSRYKDSSPEDQAITLWAIQRVSHKLIEVIETFLEDVEEYDNFAWVDEEALMDFDMETVY